jgi:hypothetical protein
MTSITTSAPDRMPQPAAAGPTPRSPQPARTDAREQRRQGDAFDRVLRSKTEAQERGAEPVGEDRDTDASRACEPDRDAESPADGDSGRAGDDVPAVGALAPLHAMASLMPMPGIAPPPRAVEAAPMPAPADANVEAAQAAFGAALHGEAGTAPVGMLGAPAAAWHVSLNDPLGAAVELRVTRPAGTGAEAAPWTLTIGSDARDAALLAHHVPLLDVRLRARAVALSHVRIEGGDEADDAHSG